jgi:hypothetical protein
MAELALHADATLELAEPPGQSGEFKIFGGATSGYPLHHSYTDADGGQFTLNDDQGNAAVLFGANASGTGGRLQVRSGTTPRVHTGIDLDGSYSTTGEPALLLYGSSRFATFRMHLPGGASVELPSDAIQDREILDEPGLGTIAEGSGPGNELTSTLGTIVSKTIRAPAQGCVMAIATCQITLNHSEGTHDDGLLGISDADDALPTNQDIDIALAAGLPTGAYRSTGACHAVFEVADEGFYTYYFLGREDSGDITIYDVQFTVVYFPTDYGPVAAASARQGAVVDEDRQPGRAPLSGAEIAAERAATEAHHLARIERELKEIQAQLEAIKEEG